jgi:hypothetical protein
MKNIHRKLLAGLSLGLISMSAPALIIDFDTGYTAGNLVGQTDPSGEIWALDFGDTSGIDVASYSGSNVMSLRGSDASGAVGVADFLPTTGELGFAFDNTSSVVTYSVDIARQAATPGLVRFDLVGDAKNDVIVRFEFFETGMNFIYNNSGTGTGQNPQNTQLTGSPFPTAGDSETGFLNANVTLDFANNLITSVQYNGVERLTSSLTLGDRADTETSLGISVEGRGTEPYYFDNITIIPEPSTFALVGIALGAAFFIRRRK